MLNTLLQYALLFFICLCTLASSHSLYAQNQDGPKRVAVPGVKKSTIESAPNSIKQSDKSNSSELKKSFRLGVHAGLANAQHFSWRSNLFKPLRLTVKQKGKRGKSKTVRKEMGVGLDIGGFQHPNNSTAANFHLNLERYKIAHSGIFTHLGLGIGYQRLAHNIPTLELDEDGTLYEFQGGRGGFSPLAFFGFGVASKRSPLRVHMNHRFFLQMPYNTSLAPYYQVELGLSFSLGK